MSGAFLRLSAATRKLVGMISEKHKKQLWLDVWGRDGGRCVLCGKPSTGGCHEIISKAQLPGKHNETKLYQLKNMCRLCQPCHERAGGKRGELLVLLKERHHYDYSDEPFTSYVDIEEGGIG